MSTKGNPSNQEKFCKLDYWYIILHYLVGIILHMVLQIFIALGCCLARFQNCQALAYIKKLSFVCVNSEINEGPFFKDVQFLT